MVAGFSRKAPPHAITLKMQMATATKLNPDDLARSDYHDLLGRFRRLWNLTPRSQEAQTQARTTIKAHAVSMR